jgi:membrane-bound lytic murein transglycosylase D
VLAALASGCATQPQSEPSLPDRVIRNVPAGSDDSRATEHRSTRPLPPPSLHDDLPPPLPTDHPDLLDRVRAGYQLAAVEHPLVSGEFDWYVRNASYLQRVFGRAQRYLHHVTVELESRGMPLELALLPVVESAYNPFAESRSHAVGLWQFIAPTGERFGLKRNAWQDQRRDVVESTRAALDYLQFLYDAFDGDWLLAIAAYNNGRLNVQRSMERNRAAGLPTDFFSLSLPAETRAYVPKLLALSRLVLNPALYGVRLPAVPNAPYFTVVDTGGPVELRSAAGLAGIEFDELRALNPAWQREITDPAGPHRLLLPAAVAGPFMASFAALDPGLRQRTADAAARIDTGGNATVSRIEAAPASASTPASERVRSHVVRRGDTLWSLAARYGVTVAALAQANSLSWHSPLRLDTRLTIPDATTAARTDVVPPATRRVRYTVRRGDTLAAISRRFAVTVAALRDWNGLRGSALRPGQRLVIHLDSRRDYGG